MKDYNLNSDSIKEKNKKLLLLVGILLLAGGISLAYYVSNILSTGEGSTVTSTTATINGSELNVEGTLNFTDANFYPGHKMVSAIKVTATGNNEIIPYNLIWNGTNSISSLNYTVYKVSSELDIQTACEKEEKVVNGSQQLSESCTVSNIDSLGEPISSGSINKNDNKVILKEDEIITAMPNGLTIYYYIILEYPNLDTDQSTDMSSTINGKVTVEKSNAEPDINILAVYVKGENGEYTEQNEIPEGYQVNTEKSTCSNGASPSGVTPDVMVNSLTTTGTSCYLYLDKTANSQILKNTIINSGTPDFSTIATTDEGVYKMNDGIYGGTSYYFRGSVTNNYIKFGNFCWRIIRINGDGSIRMIYDGTSCHVNGASTTESIAKSKIYYARSDGKRDRSYYVGWTYGTGQRTLSGTNSNAKTQLENWYTNESNFTNTQKNQIVDGKFCNDRNTLNDETWRDIGSSQYYAAYKRMRVDYKPTLDCYSGDTYILTVGLITADEVMLAGGKAVENKSYYLYNGQNYWTMTPFLWDSGNANLFLVNINGLLDWSNGTCDLRPVINLKADTVISGGSGLYNDPYIVA